LVAGGDFEDVASASGEVELFGVAVPGRRRAILCHAAAEARDAALGVLGSEVEAVRNALVAVRT
jgi:hypothetical protein